MRKKHVQIRIIVLLMIALILSGCATVEAVCEDPELEPGYEILVSTCRDARVEDVSPDGRHVLVNIFEPSKEIILINLETGQETKVYQTAAAITRFFDNDIAIIGTFRFYFISENRWVIGDFHNFINPEEPLDDAWLNTFDPTEAQVYLYDEIHMVYVIQNDFLKIDVYYADIRTYALMTEMLETHGIPYEKRTSTAWRCEMEEDCVSHDGRFYTGERATIYLADGTLIKEQGTSRDRFQGWAYDDRRLLIDRWGGGSAGALISTNYAKGAVVIYNISEKYLPPTPVP